MLQILTKTVNIWNEMFESVQIGRNYDQNIRNFNQNAHDFDGNVLYSEKNIRDFG